MRELQKDVVVIGGGPAGLAAAVRLSCLGADVLVLEREEFLGGILHQCIHDGFGLQRFRRPLSGPEYAQRFIDEVQFRNVPFYTGCTVTQLDGEGRVTAVSRQGQLICRAKAVVLATGCRERTRGALAIPGQRPAGVFTAGVAQNYINLHNLKIGKKAVVLGSGDIGLIMARRLTLEGIPVEGVYEIQPYPSGLPRNLQQCLYDFDIPLHLSHTVVEIHGTQRLQGVTVARVDDTRRPIMESRHRVACDTLILSVGLIPENELALMAGVELDPRTGGAVVDGFYRTSVRGIFQAGNALQVHDLVDDVSRQAEELAEAVGLFLAGKLPAWEQGLPLVPGREIASACPQLLHPGRKTRILFRPARPLEAGAVELRQGGALLARREYAGLQPAQMASLECGSDGLRESGGEVTMQWKKQ